MDNEHIVTVVEIDIDTCTRTYGVSPCLAAMNTANPRKCYNTFSTCQYRQAYNRSTLTIRFCEPTFPIKSGVYIPALKGVKGYEQEINIAGYSPNIGGLGRRASVSVEFTDFTDRDTLTDKYWEQRMSGAAQINEGGYDPLDRGTFWTKFKARNPNYAGRSLRVIQGRITAAGVFVPVTTRSYVMTEMVGPQNNGRFTITAKDILSLADNTKALAPVTNSGKLLANIDASVGSLTLTPSGIGNLEYPAAGYATIGSEIVRFTRTGDAVNIARAQRGTQAATHSANDTFQLAFDVRLVRADSVIRSLLVDYAGIPSSYINFSEWQAEFNRWGSTLLLSATITKPTGVTTLISEINQLGVTVWWDEVAQKIRLKLNHPPEETPKQWSDRNNIISITQEDNDDERATRIDFWHVQIDPTKDLNKDNFLRGSKDIFVDGENDNFYGESRTKTIYTRWLNQGADNAIRIIAGRLLNRYQTAPVTYNVKIDAKDDPSLTDVVSLSTHVATDITGLPATVLTQVYYRKDDQLGSTVDVKLQRFQFDVTYGVITENTRPRYPQSTEAQKNRGTYWVGPSLSFADGRPAYRFI